MTKTFKDYVYEKMYPRTTKTIADFGAAFTKGFDFVPNNIAKAQKNYCLNAPNGHVRHLNGYFLDMIKKETQYGIKYDTPQAYARNNRQATNSLVQGFASEVGCMAGYVINKIMWHLTKNKCKTGFKYLNVVHDSVETEVKYEHIPACLYAIESAFTNLVAREYEKLFNFPFLCDLSVEMDVGAFYNVENLYTWNWSQKSLDEVMSKVDQDVTFKITKEMKRKFVRNWNIIKKWRLKEMREAVAENKSTAYTGSYWKECYNEYIKANRED